MKKKITDREKEQNKRIRTIKILMTLHEYKEYILSTNNMDLRKKQWQPLINKIKILIDDKLYINDPIYLSPEDIIKICSLSQYNKWLRESKWAKDYEINFKLNQLLMLSTKNVRYISNRRNQILRKLTNE